MENPVETQLETHKDTEPGIGGPDSWHLYSEMLRCRCYEIEVKRLWQEGAIPGEMHLSMGEEGVVVGIVDQLVDGDAMALDHRGTAPMLVRGVDPVLMLKEFMGTTGWPGWRDGRTHALVLARTPHSVFRDCGVIRTGGGGIWDWLTKG